MEHCSELKHLQNVRTSTWSSIFLILTLSCGFPSDIPWPRCKGDPVCIFSQNVTLRNCLKSFATDISSFFASKLIKIFIKIGSKINTWQISDKEKVIHKETSCFSRENAKDRNMCERVHGTKGAVIDELIQHCHRHLCKSSRYCLIRYDRRKMLPYITKSFKEQIRLCFPQVSLWSLL